MTFCSWRTRSHHASQNPRFLVVPPRLHTGCGRFPSAVVRGGATAWPHHSGAGTEQGPDSGGYPGASESGAWERVHAAVVPRDRIREDVEAVVDGGLPGGGPRSAVSHCAAARPLEASLRGGSVSRSRSRKARSVRLEGRHRSSDFGAVRDRCRLGRTHPGDVDHQDRHRPGRGLDPKGPRQRSSIASWPSAGFPWCICGSGWPHWAHKGGLGGESSLP